MPNFEPIKAPVEFRARSSQLSPENALAKASPAISKILEKSLSGKDIDFDDAMLIAKSQPEDLPAILSVADELRRRTVGEAITYVVNRNLNFTNVCFVGCSFCGFSRGPHAPDSYFHPTHSLIEKAREAVLRGATEVCIQGGLPRDLDGYYYRDLLRDIKTALPAIHIHAFSPMEIAFGVEKSGLALPDYLLMLKEAGLGSIPGTAAEILDDKIRGRLSPNKLHAAQWVEIIRTAHSLGIPSTSTMMYGHVESPEHWVRHILLLRQIQHETSGFTEFVPLGFVHSQTRLYRIGGARPGNSLSEHLLVHALARILLYNSIPNLQVSWVKMGFETSLACLNAGANDFGGTLMEESISKAAGASFGESVTAEEFQAMIGSIDRVPAERTTTYRIRRRFAAPDVSATQTWPADAASSPARVSGQVIANQ
jgi:7,8-didemethyl-8-hydroxy-5-deazariboflavin synthase CofH subunit